ncbi:MAG: DUF6690 family protein [Thermoguttaceae bacterium]
MNLKLTLLYGLVLALALGGPISLFSASDFAGKMRELFGGVASKKPAEQRSSGAVPPSAANDSTPIIPASYPPPDTTPTPSLSDVLTFDVTVEWVMQRWPRVSTGLTYLQLQGYRVPLVSGTTLRDVAGSLTYYFNAAQQVERITLRGTTGDPTDLVSILGSRHHFARRLTNDPGLVLYEAVDSNNQIVGTLKIRSAKVVKATEPYSRFEVDLVMDRPR